MTDFCTVSFPLNSIKRGRNNNTRFEFSSIYLITVRVRNLDTIPNANGFQNVFGLGTIVMFYGILMFIAYCAIQ
jgi:hypothetical protein